MDKTLKDKRDKILNSIQIIEGIHEAFNDAVATNDKCTMIELHAKLAAFTNEARKLFPDDDPDFKEMDEILALAEMFKPKVSNAEYQKHINKQKNKVKKTKE